jgi:hypothetical protein
VNHPEVGNLKKAFARQRARDLAERAKLVMNKDNEINSLKKEVEETRHNGFNEVHTKNLITMFTRFIAAVLFKFSAFPCGAYSGAALSREWGSLEIFCVNDNKTYQRAFEIHSFQLKGNKFPKMS